MAEFDININFDFYSDARGGDPDKTSPTLRRYHKLLWSKALPNGKTFNLSNEEKGYYLYHKSELGEFSLGSDAITHSYKNQKRKQWIFKKLPAEVVDELFKAGSTIGSYIIFPNKQINRKQTINQMRGMLSKIDDRFDLTLECIRLYYLNKPSPLYETLLRYKKFFALFENFSGYVNFFLLQDLLDDDGQIKFYLPFDSFKSRPKFRTLEDYLLYRKQVLEFIKSRNTRIENYVDKIKS